jgi:competence protein ComEC
MFSLISVGQNVQRSYNIYNVLAGAAIIQLCLNPFTIMEVGFQLSYAAVLGIVMFQKFFYDLIFIKYKWLDYFWQITCVSISAQLITFPIGLLYFHQFPIYFFVSNLVVIPAALGIMLTGITMFILSPVPYTSFVLGKILNFGILLMNKAVFVVEQIPYSLIQGLTISILEAWIIYVLVFLFFLVIHYKHPKIIIVSLVCVLFLTGINTIENYRQLNQKQLVFYNTPKSTYAYDFISGKENLLLASKSLTKDYSQMQFHIMHNWWEQDVRKNNIAEYSNEFQFQKGKNFYKQGNFIQFYNQKIMLINGSLPQVDVEQKLKVDYIILNNNPEVKLKNIAKLYDYKLIIADGSNSAKNNRRWKQEAEKDEINFRSVNENGAFVLNL